MDQRNCPPVAVLLTLVVLSITAFFGLIWAASSVTNWWNNRHVTMSLVAIGAYTLAFAILPMLAIIDLCLERILGRYLGVLSMMLTWALLLRVVILSFANVPVSRGGIVFAVFVACGFLTAFATLIGGLAFSRIPGGFFEAGQAR